ncbi:UNVERIFIED_CONTAM: hypothetical protein GTU68_066117, partial [Idotea baltica]|nr:hypothetical protein [Idotea baltica]
SETDKQLIDQFIGGQTEAFGTLVLRHQDRLFNSLLRVVVSRDEAADVAQDAFLNAYRKIDSFRGDSAFYSWLFRIAMNVALSRKRKQKREPASLDAVQEAGGDRTVDPDPASQPSSRMELTEQQSAVQDALAQLSEEHRVVIVLKEIEGLKYEEIAEIVECPVGTVRSRLSRARMELRDRLRRHLSDD